jgi:hypothetical protein
MDSSYSELSDQLVCYAILKSDGFKTLIKKGMEVWLKW